MNDGAGANPAAVSRPNSDSGEAGYVPHIGWPYRGQRKGRGDHGRVVGLRLQRNGEDVAPGVND